MSASAAPPSIPDASAVAKAAEKDLRPAPPPTAVIVAQVSPPPPPPPPSLRLLGTAVEPGQETRAVILRDTGEVAVSRIGDRIGALTLVEIHDDRIVVEYAGSRQTVRLPQEGQMLSRPGY